jgi:Rrf2 family protein
LIIIWWARAAEFLQKILKSHKPQRRTGVYLKQQIVAMFYITSSVELSCKSEYALLALLELAAHYQEGEPLQIRQIATQQNIPDRYLEQLLANLRRAGLVRSQRGARGGYLLAREPWKISLSAVVDCIEGLDSKPVEKSWNTETVEKTVVREAWQEVCQAANLVLQNYTLQDLCERRDAKRQLDIMYYI